ncbi:hypothetical protein HUJ04_008853 [Dendroctonus ponderosae]|nr:hypothetical protein HUJ04_008853 [Dendroctonus ponderosae]
MTDQHDEKKIEQKTNGKKLVHRSIHKLCSLRKILSSKDSKIEAVRKVFERDIFGRNVARKKSVSYNKPRVWFFRKSYPEWYVETRAKMYRVYILIVILVIGLCYMSARDTRQPHKNSPDLIVKVLLLLLLLGWIPLLVSILVGEPLRNVSRIIDSSLLVTTIWLLISSIWIVLAFIMALMNGFRDWRRSGQMGALGHITIFVSRVGDFKVLAFWRNKSIGSLGLVPAGLGASFLLSGDIIASFISDFRCPIAQSGRHLKGISAQGIAVVQGGVGCLARLEVHTGWTAAEESLRVLVLEDEVQKALVLMADIDLLKTSRR